MSQVLCVFRDLLSYAITGDAYIPHKEIQTKTIRHTVIGYVILLLVCFGSVTYIANNHLGNGSSLDDSLAHLEYVAEIDEILTLPEKFLEARKIANEGTEIIERMLNEEDNAQSHVDFYRQRVEILRTLPGSDQGKSKALLKMMEDNLIKLEEIVADGIISKNEKIMLEAITLNKFPDEVYEAMPCEQKVLTMNLMFEVRDALNIVYNASGIAREMLTKLSHGVLRHQDALETRLVISKIRSGLAGISPILGFAFSAFFMNFFGISGIIVITAAPEVVIHYYMRRNAFARAYGSNYNILTFIAQMVFGSGFMYLIPFTVAAYLFINEETTPPLLMGLRSYLKNKVEALRGAKRTDTWNYTFWNVPYMVLSSGSFALTLCLILLTTNSIAYVFWTLVDNYDVEIQETIHFLQIVPRTIQEEYFMLFVAKIRAYSIQFALILFLLVLITAISYVNANWASGSGARKLPLMSAWKRGLIGGLIKLKGVPRFLGFVAAVVAFVVEMTGHYYPALFASFGWGSSILSVISDEGAISMFSDWVAPLLPLETYVPFSLSETFLVTGFGF